MAKKEKKKIEKDSPEKWGSVPATAFKSEEDMLKEMDVKKRGNYEEKVAVDISFEDLIKLSVTNTDTPKKENKPN